MPANGISPLYLNEFYINIISKPLFINDSYLHLFVIQGNIRSSNENRLHYYYYIHLFFIRYYLFMDKGWTYGVKSI